MDLSKVKSIIIPEGIVRRIEKDEHIIWEPFTRLKSITGANPTDYILTDISVSSIYNTVIEAKGKLSRDGGCGLYGARKSADLNSVAMVRGDRTQSHPNEISYLIRQFSTLSAADKASAATQTAYFIDGNASISIHSEPKNSYVETDNEGRKFISLSSSYDLYGDTSVPVPLMILAINNNGAVSNNQGIRTIEYFKMWEYDVLTHHLIPVLDKDGIPCAHDLVTGRYYYVANGGKLDYEFL